MSVIESNHRFTEQFVIESDAIVVARARSAELGIDPISPATGAQIAVIAAATNPLNMIEIGTGAGVSGLWLFAGAPDATLTTIDIEADHSAEARIAFADGSILPARARLITGRATDVLPRMNERSYDIVLVDADAESMLDYVEHGLRLVRRGGTVLVTHALWHGRVADPVQRDETTSGYRLLLKEIAGSDAVISSLSAVGDGLLQLTKRTD